MSLRPARRAITCSGLDVVGRRRPYPRAKGRPTDHQIARAIHGAPLLATRLALGEPRHHWAYRDSEGTGTGAGNLNLNPALSSLKAEPAQCTLTVVTVASATAMLQRFLLTEIVTAEGKVAKDEGALNSAVVLKHLMLYSSINL